MSASIRQIDVRDITPRERHPLIFSTFRGLDGAEAMEIVNDHDPRPLYYQMQAEQPGQFSWDYVENGPFVWRVRITRRAGNGAHAQGGCCGACGGA
ncbi:MAG: DUF2249 domain-containing protein [Burkholderiales bacterium]|nr:DUF2249 domain-containing protein [Burkholderiales bacterium]